MESPNSSKVKHRGAKSRAYSSYSLTPRVLFTKNPSWQDKQSIKQATGELHSNCIKMREDFTLNFDKKRTGSCMMTKHCLTLHLSPGNVSPKNMKIVPTLLFSIALIEDKTERTPFYDK
jgi:hypothetical protein